jgi:hypothetical protein
VKNSSGGSIVTFSSLTLGYTAPKLRGEYRDSRWIVDVRIWKAAAEPRLRLR